MCCLRTYENAQFKNEPIKIHLWHVGRQLLEVCGASTSNKDGLKKKNAIIKVHTKQHKKELKCFIGKKKLEISYKQYKKYHAI
jgi:hypothetical protein